jgi:hypothetical protein
MEKKKQITRIQTTTVHLYLLAKQYHQMQLGMPQIDGDGVSNGQEIIDGTNPLTHWIQIQTEMKVDAEEA